MARDRDVSWDDWKGYVERPGSETIKKKKKLRKTKKELDEDMEEELEKACRREADRIVRSAKAGKNRQPTNEELFGHLVPSEEQVEKADKDWENRFNDHFDLANIKCDHLNRREELEDAWQDGKSFNDILEEEEVAKRDKASLKSK